MANFPTTFVSEHIPLTPRMLDEPGAEALEHIQNRGFEVVAGLRRDDVVQLTSLANQEGIREYCPKDAITRFPDDQVVEHEWLPKNGGRAAFLLRRRLGEIAGLGWTGLEENKELPDCETTFAIRLHENTAGQGLGTPFTQVIVFGSMALYGAQRIGLETWGSNRSAVKAYIRAGAELVSVKDDKRPTLSPAPNETDGMRRDVRLFMQFPQSFPDNNPYN